MGLPHRFTPERLVVAVLASRPDRLDVARAALVERFGPVDVESDPVPWHFTSYYDREMGPAIERRFWSFARPVDPADLAAIKLATNAIEDAHREAGDRKLNLDPGLLSLSRFVLATTKDGSHRVPLRDGIYAEVTLVFEHGEWRPLPWTYPDYRDPGQLAVLAAIREHHRLEMRGRRPGR